MLDWIKEGTVGDWSIMHFEITKNQAMMYTIGCYGSYEIPPSAGKYTKLVHSKRGVIMSDTRQEIMQLGSLRSMLRKFPDSEVHISGLGLGIAAKIALDGGHSVEVVEIEKDVIDLVGSQLLPLYPKLTIIHADALKWNPPKGKKYGVTWHDIWDEINLDLHDEHKLLMRKWGRRTMIQDYWASDSIRRMMRDRDRW